MENRASGYYFVRTRSTPPEIWLIAEYSDFHKKWYMVGEKQSYENEDFYEIDERIITHDVVRRQTSPAQ